SSAAAPSSTLTGAAANDEAKKNAAVSAPVSIPAVTDTDAAPATVTPARTSASAACNGRSIRTSAPVITAQHSADNSRSSGMTPPGGDLSCRDGTTAQR